MSELSHFESLSVKTPTKQPYAILGGTVLGIIILILLNALAPNEAVKEGKQKEAASLTAEAPAAAAAANDDDEL